MPQSQYAQPSDLTQFAITQAQSDRYVSAAGSGVLTSALQGASSIADGYLAGQFDLPLISFTFELKLHVCNIAAWLLFCQFGGGNAAAPTDARIEKRYSQAIAWLELVRDKKLFPVFVDSSGTGQPAGVYAISDRPVGFTHRGDTSCEDNGGAWWRW